MKSKMFLALGLMSFSSFALAATDCTKLLESYANHQRRSESMHARAVAQLRDDARVAAAWYGELSRYEGQTVRLPYGMFDAIRTSSDTMYSNARSVEDAFGTIDREADTLLQSVKDCMK